MVTIDFNNISQEELKNPRMKRAYDRYIRELEKIAINVLLSFKNSK